MNSVTLVGRLARDPEISYTIKELPVCNFTLAVARPKKDGEDRGADFIRITVFGKQGENCHKYLEKGRMAAVHGRLHTDSFKGRDGQTVNMFDIVADNVEFLGGGQQQTTQKDDWADTGFKATDDRVPF